MVTKDKLQKKNKKHTLEKLGMKREKLPLEALGLAFLLNRFVLNEKL